MTQPIIRLAKETDIDDLLAIFTPYVTDTAITFQYDIPSRQDFLEKYQSISQDFPFIVAEEAGEVVGYAYATPFRKEAAYAWSAEPSIYLKQDRRGNGLGKRLYNILEKLLKKQHILQMVACIAYTEGDNPYLTNSSPRFHEKLGYETIAHFPKCSYKFQNWYDCIWMRKLLVEEIPVVPQEIIPFSKLNHDLDKLLENSGVL